MAVLKFEKLVNCRDLGGMLTADGRKIKSGCLLRSETLSDASPADIQRLVTEYGLKTVVDFRTDVERREKPDPEIDGVNNVFLPILRHETLGITRESVNVKTIPVIFENMPKPAERYMGDMYGSIALDGFATEHYSEFFRILLESEGTVLWHCTVGKDRAGMGTAFLLYALGVPMESIIQDYLLTDICYRKKNRKLFAAITLFVRKKETRDYLRCLLSVKREFIEAAFRQITEKYGSVEAYLEKALGLTEEKITLLRNKYLE